MLLKSWLSSFVSNVNRPVRKHKRQEMNRRRDQPFVQSVENLESRALLTITFQFEYSGTIGSGIGFEDATNGQARRDALELAGQRLGSIFDNDATITMSVTSIEDSGDSTLAAAGSSFNSSPVLGFNNNEVVRTKILSGTDLNASAVDGTVEVNWGQNWEIGSDPTDVDSSEFDFLSTMYHELLHSVGWLSTPTESGQDLNDAAPTGQAGAWGYFDQFITDVGGTPIIDGTSFALDASAWNTHKVGGASPAAGLYFNGTMARAANGGNPVGLYTPTTFSNGSSVSHLDDENPALADLMMLSATDTGLSARNLTTLERAVLMDIGYSLVSGGISVSQTGGTTSVSESGSTDLLDVSLTVQPLSDVVLDVSSDDTGEATVDTATLTFTPDNWSTPQTVTVTGVDDAIADSNQTATITLSVNAAASDDGYDATTSATIPVSVIDDESGFSVTQSGADTTVSESGTTDTFDVVLNTTPASNVVFLIGAVDTTEVAVDLATLTFTPTDWNVAQTVTVTGVDDPTVDGAQTSAVSISVDDANSDDAFDSLADQSVGVTTSDDDIAGVTASETGGSTSVSEAGTSDVIDVVLNAQPLSDVVLDVSSDDGTELSSSPSTLTFTPSNWSLTQQITVTGVDDPAVDGDQTTSVMISVNAAASDDAFDSLTAQTVSATTVDNDAAAFTITESDASTSTTEGGSTDTFDVALTAAPESDVVFTVSSGDTTEATVDLALLTFSPANWNSPQTVTVTGVDDMIVDGDQTTTITLSIDDVASNDAFDALADQTVSVTTTDDDVAEFTVTESSGTTVSETGTTDTFEVVLSAEPVSDVVLSLSSDDTGEATIDSATLTFTPTNWSTAQTVTVTGVDDLLLDGPQASTVTLAVDAAASDDAFDALADKTVSVTTSDNEVIGFSITESDGSTTVTEAGSTDDITVAVTAPVSSDVVIAVATNDAGEGTLDVASLTFTPANWNTPQIVTVTGVDDALADGDQTSTVTLSIDAAASDDAFDTLSDQTVSVTTTDDESAGYTVTETDSSTSVSESGTTDSFDVVLSAQPENDVVVSIGSNDTGEATVSSASLTFTTSDWNTVQTVTVTGVDDPAVDGDQTLTVTLSIDDAASDDQFDPLANQTVSVTTTDNDTAGFLITDTNGTTTVNESGTTDTFTVELTAQPLSDVTISVTSDDTAEATVDAASLVFTPANWDSAQTVTVTGVDDSTTDGDQTSVVTLSVNDASSDDAFDALADQTVSVSTVDDDVPPSLSISPDGITTTDDPIPFTFQFGATVTGFDVSDISVTNGTARTFTIVDGDTFTLNVAPTSGGDVTVSVAAGAAVGDNNLGNTEASATVTSNLDGAATPPVIDDVASILNDARPTLTWSAVTDAASYEIWFTRVTPGQTRLHFGASIVTAPSWTPPVDLDPAVYRFWVRSFNGSGTAGPWSAEENFEHQPTLITPLAPAFEKLPTFRWNAIPFASSYEVYVRTSDPDTGVNGDIIVEVPDTQTFWTPASELPGGPIRWWVRATDSIGNSGWSAVGETSVDGRSSITAASNSNVSWQSVSGAGRYILHIEEADSRNVVVRMDNLTGSTYAFESALGSGNYRAWVKAIDSSTNLFSSGAWSKAFDFFVGDANETSSDDLSLTSLEVDIRESSVVDRTIEYTLVVGDSDTPDPTVPAKPQRTEKHTIARNAESNASTESPINEELAFLDAVMAESTLELLLD